MTKPDDIGTATSLRTLYDGDHERFVEEATGQSPEAIRAMSFEDRQRILAIIGVNVPDQKPETPMKRAHFAD